MRLTFIFILTIFIFGCQASQPIKSENTSGISILGLIFGITKNETGDVTTMRFSSAQDVATKSAINFKLPPNLLAQATTDLTEHWSASKADYEPGIEFFVICVYTNIEPDNAGCSRGK